MSSIIFAGVHAADGENSRQIGSHVVTKLDKNVAASLLSLFVFCIFSAFLPTMLLFTLFFSLSSVHAILRVKPPVLASKRRQEREERTAVATATSVEEGVQLMEEDLDGGGPIRSRGAGGGGGAGGGVGGGGGGRMKRPGRFVTDFGGFKTEKKSQ